MDNYIFDVNLNGEIKPVIVLVRHEPDDDDYTHYDVYHADLFIGTIHPDFDSTGNIVWIPGDGISKDLAKELGQKISALDL